VRPARVIAGRALARAVVVVVVALWLVPTVGLLVTSFRAPEDVEVSGWWTALKHLGDFGQWTSENYSEVLDAEGFGTAILNSLAVAVPSTVFPTVIGLVAAYALAWMGFRGRRLVLGAMVGLLVVPIQMALIPVLRMYTEGVQVGGATVLPALGLSGEFVGLWLAHTGFGIPMAVYLLGNAMRGLPRELVDAARVDGASEWEILLRHAVPLTLPAIASFCIFQFLWVYNDLLVAIVFLSGSPETQVVTQVLTDLNGTRGQDWELLTAGAFVSIVIPLLVFFALQRYFVRGLTAGAVKG
jgi:alpha-glucoside transport system permease protein